MIDQAPIFYCLGMKKKLTQKFAVIIFGPTGVGKTGLAEELAAHMPAQLVNCDIGQFYTSLSIGTAKPDYKSSSLKQHLFDIIDEPKYFNVCQYRELVLNVMQDIWREDKLPILVGGSGFYLRSLLFPPISDEDSDCTKQDNKIKKNNGEQLWKKLNKIDSKRASQIKKEDTYRICRALEIWEKTGQKPSAFTPVYNFPSNFLFVFLNRERQELYVRINMRTYQMITEGWVEEVKELLSTPWEQFLLKKKIIGYDDIISFLKGAQTKQDLQSTIEIIQKKTRNYAKRQVTFFRSFEKLLQKAIEETKEKEAVTSSVKTVDLSLSNSDMYVKQLLEYLKPLFK